MDLLRKAGVEDVDFLRESLQHVLQRLIELEAALEIGAGKYQRSDERKTHRNGYRDRSLDTRLGTVDLRIPKLRQGTYFPSLLEPRRMVEQTLVNVIQEAYVLGVSTRKVDDLVKAMGLEGIDKSQVSRLCQELDERVQQFRNRRLDSGYPYLWLDATYVNVRTEGRVVSIAVVVAVAVNEDGQREVIGFAAGPAESEGFWLDFLRSLVGRGLKGVLLVISDAHAGLRKAIKTVLTGAAWQRCRVHFMRNILSVVTKTAQSAVSAAVRTIFQQPDIESARAQLGRVAEGLRERFPKVTERLYEAQEDVLAYMSFPEQHRRRLHSTNTLERLNKEIKRRTNVVQIFPNVGSLIRLIGAILSEQNDEWLVGKRYFSIGSMRSLPNAAQLEPGETAENRELLNASN